MRLHVGLASINVTLHNLHAPVKPFGSNVTIFPHEDDAVFFYNERIRIFKPETLEPSMETAIQYGLPIPLLSVIHFLTSAQIQFHWSQDIMEAGYHCYCALTFALGSWILSILFVAGVPRYSCYTFIFTGLLMITNSAVYFYWVHVESQFPPIFISGEFIELK
jgi:dual oxidase maturation factor 1